ncbi:MAG: hypothetical protein ACI8QS_003552 [Planctomycetota bacterium]|jgi:hypothetical protein
MKTLLTASVALAAGLLLVGTVFAKRSSAPLPSELPPLPATPQSTTIEVLEVQSFTLSEHGMNRMRADGLSYNEGVLLVLRAEPERWQLRQSFDNVLYVGQQTATRVNHGASSGNLVVIVPGPLDLSAARIFLGEPDLPERITQAELERQVDLAQAAGVEPLGAGLTRVRQAQTLHAADELELYLHASYLVERYAPDERDLINGLRVKRVPGR